MQFNTTYNVDESQLKLYLLYFGVGISSCSPLQARNNCRSLITVIHTGNMGRK